MNERAIDTIRPYEKNAKEHPKKQVQQIADSIREFGFNQPIVVDKAGVIIVGHGRYEAAKLLELAVVPVIEIDISEEKAKAYRLADNKLNESDWDMDLVIAELKELTLPMLDLTGFSRDLVLETDDKDDVIPGAPKTPRSKLGDVYVLGGTHRLVVGDSTKPETYKALMGGVHADMVFTDPPYNVNYKGTPFKKERTWSEGIENDDMEDAQFDVFLENAFKSIIENVKGGAGWYVFHAVKTQSQFRRALEAAGLDIKQELIWNKIGGVVGWSDYHSKHESFYYAVHKGKKAIFYGDRSNHSVWDFSKTEKELIAWVKRQKRLEAEGRTTIWTMKKERVDTYVHPTQKPVELITYAIVNSSKEGDIVLDPFMGSGSTMIAAHKTNRVGYGVELDPTFADVIVQRFVDYTGITEVERNGEIEGWEMSTT